MTVPAYSEQDSSFDEFQLDSAQTLQDMHNISASIFERYKIHHAVLLYMPSPAHSLTLPLLPIEPNLQEILLKAVNSNTHPAVNYNRQFGKPKPLSEFTTAVTDMPILTELMGAFREAGMRQVYELPLTPRQHVRFILEVARNGQAISSLELAELQSIASIIPGKLPEFLISPPNTAFMEAGFHVR